MHSISAGQIKAARALLGWTQDDLASATRISIGTIRNLESGFLSPRGSTMHTLRQVIESAGIEFMAPEGVNRRTDEVRVYEGPSCSEALLDDILQTVKKTGGEVLVNAKTQALLAEMWDLGHPATINERWKEDIDVKCLLSTNEVLFFVPRVEFRAISAQYAGPTPYCIYGDKHALALTDGLKLRFVVIKSVALAQSYRQHFLVLWNLAAPFLIAPEAHASKCVVSK